MRRQLENISMKTIYECSQSKGVKWITVIFFLIMIFSILLSIYTVSKGVNVTEAIIVTAFLLVVSFSCFLVFPQKMRESVYVHCFEQNGYRMKTSTALNE